jgi:ADP-ribose pyrophosphatase YjhB (NUDIX family)
MADSTRLCHLAARTRRLGRMAERVAVTVGRRAARAILIDDLHRLILIKRTKAGHVPYWTAPGGGVENADASLQAALYRELLEELGAAATGATQVFLFSSPSEDGVAVQHFFVARLVSLDEAARSGPEFINPSRGGYEVDRVSLRGDDLVAINLKPAALKDFVVANREALLVEAERSVDAS